MKIIKFENTASFEIPLVVLEKPLSEAKPAHIEKALYLLGISENR